MKTLLALGANLPSRWGNPAQTLSQAVERLSKGVGNHVKLSPFYATSAFPEGSGPDFVNACLTLDCALNPEQLLELCHSVEDQARRIRGQRWGPRTLDIDLIGYGDRVLPDLQTQNKWRALPLDEQLSASPDQLILPHPRLQDRAFVLVPLNDVAPGWVHPVLGDSVAEMLSALPEQDKRAVKRLETP